MVSSGLGGGAAARSRQDTGTNLLQELEALSQALYKASQAQNVDTGAPTGPSPRRDYHHHIHQKHHHTQRQQAQQPPLSPTGSGGLLRRGFPADVSNQSSAFDGGQHRRASMPATARNDAFDHILPFDNGSSQIHGRKTALQFRHSISTRPSTSLYPEQEREDLWRQQKISRHSVASVPRPLPPLSAHAEEEPLAAGAAPGAPPVQPRSERMLQPWHSQGFKKPMAEVANFPEWLDDNISFSRKFEAVPEKKSIWNWKLFRTLSHIGHTRYNCLFTLHVHAIEGLPQAMNGLRLSVHWRHKDRSVQTTPSRAFQCSAEFEETLKLRCSVYSSKSAHHTVKFMPKEFTLCVIVLDIDELMLGQHHLDLTRLLPEGPDHEHEDDGKSLSWTTSFKLSGKAKGGTLVVTFGYELLQKESDKSGRFGSVMESPSSSMSSPSLRSFGGSFSTHGTPRQRPSDGTNFVSPALSEPREYYDYKAMEHLNLDDALPSESRSSGSSGASGSNSNISGGGFGGEVRKGQPGGTCRKHHSNHDHHYRAEQNPVSPGYSESKLKGVDYPEQVPEPALAPLTPRQIEEPLAELTKEVSNGDRDCGALSSSPPPESSERWTTLETFVDLDDEEQHEFVVVDQGVEVGTLPEGIYYHRKHSRNDEGNENLERLGSSSGSGSKVATSGSEFDLSLDGPAGSLLEKDRMASLSPAPLAKFHSYNVEEVRGAPTVENPAKARQQEQEVRRQGVEEEEDQFADAVEEMIPWDPLGKYRIVQEKQEEKSRPLVDLVVRHKEEEVEGKDVVEETRLFKVVVKNENLQPPGALDDNHKEQTKKGSQQKQNLWNRAGRHQEGDHEQSEEDHELEGQETVSWETPLSTPFPANNVEFVWKNRQQQLEAGTRNSGEEVEDVSLSMELPHSSQKNGLLCETPLSTPLSYMHQERVREKDLELGEEEKGSHQPGEGFAAASSPECQGKSEEVFGTPSSTPFPSLQEKSAWEEDLQPGDEKKSLQQQSEEGLRSNGSSKALETAASLVSEGQDKSEDIWETPSSIPFSSLQVKSAWDEDLQPPFVENGEGHTNSAMMDDFDNEIDLIADDFLAMLEGNGDKGGVFAPGMSSDSESDSPRALLLKQFEKEALLEGGVGLRPGTPEIPVLNFDAAAEGLDSRHGEEYAPSFDQFDGLVEHWQNGETELALIMEAAELELQKATQTMRSKTRAKILEDAETEALMQEWGLNEKAFENTPPKFRGVLGIMSNQMEKAPARPPMLAQGLGPVVHTKDGGMLRTMTPTLFPQSSTSEKLVMQVSKPVVVPSEMGFSGLDIFRRLASSGVENMALQAMVAMPLEDITGKSVLQVAYESRVALEAPSYAQNGENTKFSTRSPGVQRTVDRTLARGAKFNGRSDLRGLGATYPSEEFVSLEELAPMALQNVEALAIDGLKIQADLADASAPYQVDALPWRGAGLEQSSNFSADGSVGSLDGVAAIHFLDAKPFSDKVAMKADGLMTKVISIGEWMRLDSGQIDENDAKDETLAILAAHGAVPEAILARGNKEDRRKYLEGAKASADFGRGGFMGNALTIAMLVQLRDPLRSNEPVGAPMMALVQAERVIYPPRPKVPRRAPSLLGNSVVWDDEEGNTRGLHTAESQAALAEPQFKIIAVHMSGLNSTEWQSKELDNSKPWGNQKQQKSGSRWLVANGMGKPCAATSSKLPARKNKSQLGKDTTAEAGESLWSISSCNSGSASKWKDKPTMSSSIRNPDVKFAKQKNRLR